MKKKFWLFVKMISFVVISCGSILTTLCTLVNFTRLFIPYYSFKSKLLIFKDMVGFAILSLIYAFVSLILYYYIKSDNKGE